MESKQDTIESCVRQLVLAKISSVPEAVSSAWKLLQPILILECTRHSKLVVKVSSKYKCAGCKKQVATKRLPECRHDICESCGRKEIARVSSESFDKRVFRAQCPKCKEPFGENGVRLFYSDEQLSEMRKTAKGKQGSVVMRTCPICMMEFSVEEQGISLECNHMFCSGCVVSYVESCIADNKVSGEFISCPVCKKVPIDDQIISHWMPKEMFDKLVKLRLRNVVTSAEFYKYCPDCDVGAFIQRDATAFECPVCKKVMCPNCNVSPLHKGPCKKELIPSWINMCGIKVCPKCGALIEKSSGCNFMTCASQKCQSKVYFCYLCGFELQKAEHYSHFKKKGPWGDYCNNTEKDYLATHPDKQL